MKKQAFSLAASLYVNAVADTEDASEASKAAAKNNDFIVCASVVVRNPGHAMLLLRAGIKKVWTFRRGCGGVDVLFGWFV